MPVHSIHMPCLLCQFVGQCCFATHTDVVCAQANGSGRNAYMMDQATATGKAQLKASRQKAMEKLQAERDHGIDIATDHREASAGSSEDNEALPSATSKGEPPSPHPMQPVAASKKRRLLSKAKPSAMPPGLDADLEDF